MDGKYHILYSTLVMSPHSSGVSGKAVFLEYGWEETGWHHISWPWQGNAKKRIMLDHLGYMSHNFVVHLLVAAKEMEIQGVTVYQEK